ncbi:hypothetical protein SGPA1_21203 [Streptomyces misionensis JCM 4497]
MAPRGRRASPVRVRCSPCGCRPGKRRARSRERGHVEGPVPHDSRGYPGPHERIGGSAHRVHARGGGRAGGPAPRPVRALVQGARRRPPVRLQHRRADRRPDARAVRQLPRRGGVVGRPLAPAVDGPPPVRLRASAP